MIAARLDKLLRLAVRPRLWPAAAAGAVPALEHWPMFTGLTYDTVIDAGAHKGQFAAFALARWPSAQLICFEPLSGPRAQLQRTLKRLAAPVRFEVRAKALGSRPGEAQMHLASRTDSSSLLPLGAEQKRLFSMRETGVETVAVTRLEDELPAADLGRTLLKIDVQGFELEVLKGAGALLGRIDTVYVECSYRALYEGQALEEEITAFLSRAGFSPAAERRTAGTEEAPIQADRLYRGG
ncbi:MAG: FkbM family methyltransferase [Oceanicaulis sp.]